jgi:DNA-binding NarL/FixJ family response regulator
MRSSAPPPGYAHAVAPPRVAILGEDPVTRTGLATLLAATGEVLVANGPGGTESPDLGPESAEVLLIDLAAPPATTPPVRPGVPLVALIAHERDAASALAAGARAVVFRHAPAERLAAALVAAHRGLLVLDDALSAWVRTPASVTAGPGGDAALTPRETEVLALLAEGLPNKRIAGRLGISDRTAKFHVESILAKLGAQSRSEAIVIAARRGLVAL